MKIQLNIDGANNTFRAISDASDSHIEINNSNFITNPTPEPQPEPQPEPEPESQPEPEPEPEPNYYLEMLDTYGDGWNGAVWHIEDSDGNEVYNFTMNSGTQEVSSVMNLENGNYRIYLDPGTYPFEVSWYLKTGSSISTNYIASGTALYDRVISLPNGNLVVDNNPPQEPQNTITVNVAFHLIRDSDQTFDMDEVNNSIVQQVADLNGDYQTTYRSMKPEDDYNYTPGNTPIKIQFQLIPNSDGENKYYSLITPDSTGWNSDLVNGTPPSIANLNPTYGINDNLTCNIYLSDPGNSGYSIAYAYLPQYSGETTGHIIWHDLRYISNQSQDIATQGRGQIMAHEMGHWLGLVHTFNGSANSGFDGDDLIMDTPYHPTAQYFQNSWLDSNNEPWPPESTNIPNTGGEAYQNSSGRDPIYNVMNYGWGPYDQRFTDDQCYTMWTCIRLFLPTLWSTGNKTVNKNYKMRNITHLKCMLSDGGMCGCKHPFSQNTKGTKTNKYINKLQSELKNNLELLKKNM